MTPVQLLTVWIVPLILAFTLHEAGHAYAAYLCGDRTAYEQGRLSLNPLRHIDPLGSILLPGIGILAGVFANLILLTLSLALLYTLPLMPASATVWLEENLKNSAQINAWLFVLNLLPVPGFDGARVLVALLPVRLGQALERYAYLGTLILLALFLVVPMVTRALHVDFDPYRTLVAIPGLMLELGIAHLLGLA